jgi:hypothetical protein
MAVATGSMPVSTEFTILPRPKSGGITMVVIASSSNRKVPRTNGKRGAGICAWGRRFRLPSREAAPAGQAQACPTNYTFTSTGRPWNSTARVVPAHFTSKLRRAGGSMREPGASRSASVRRASFQAI